MSTLRPFRLNDLFRYNHVNLDALTETYNASFYGGYLRRWPQYCVVVEDVCNRVVAYMLGKSEGRESRQEWHGHVSAVTVAPEYRRQGLASLLMTDLETTADKEGCWFVDLFVRASNKNAIRFYKRRGYVVYRRVLRYYGDNKEDALDMRKACSKDENRETVVPLDHPVHPEDITWD